MERDLASRPNRLGKLLNTSRLAGVLEIGVVFAAAAIVILLGLQVVGENLLARQAVVVAGNVVMLILVWASLYCRGENISRLGLAQNFGGWKSIALGFAKSLLVVMLAMAGFVLGSIVMVNITGMPQQADISAYDYLQGNFPLLLVSLASIYLFSSFGEEVIYRGFLIARFESLFGNDRKAVVWAVIVSSVIFGLAHFGWGITGVVQTTFMGLALAWSFILFKRNLWILIAAHAYMDTALILPLYFGQN